MKWQGIFPAMVTPFSDDANIDFDVFREHIERMLEAGNHGLVINAVTGEGPSLTPDERALCVSAAVKVAAGRVPVVGTVGSVSIAETISDAQRAEQAGAAAIMIITPYFYKLSQAEKLGFFLRVSEKVKIPFFIYNTTYTSGQLGLDDLQMLASATDRFVGLKEGGQMQASEAVRLLSPQVSIFASRDSYINELAAAGGAGAVTYSSNLVPRLPVAIWEAHLAGNHSLALALQQVLNPIALALVVKSFPNGVKAGVNAMGLRAGRLRLPLIDLEKSAGQAILEMVRTAERLTAELGER